MPATTIRGVEDAGRYLVLDRWTDERRYRAFLTARRDGTRGAGGPPRR